MSVNLIYQKLTDQVADNATSVLGTASDSAYPPANLYDFNPAKPAKLTGTTGDWVWSFAARQRIDLAAIIHHNLTAGLNVRFQGNDTNVWGAPTLDTTITIPAYRDDGYPSNPWKDLTGVTGYTTAGFFFWRLAIVGVNGAPVAIGDVWLGSVIRRLDPNIDWGVKVEHERKTVEHETDFGVMNVYDLGVTIRRFSGNLDTTDAQRELLLAQWESVHGRVSPWLMIPNGDVNDAWLVRWGRAMNEKSFDLIDRNTIPFEAVEVGRGLIL